jgi:Family of unknown function (DUF6191)
MSFLEIFEPGLKNPREEKERQKMLVVRPSHGDGAPLGIDLDGGTATFSVTPPRTAITPVRMVPLSRTLWPDSHVTVCVSSLRRTGERMHPTSDEVDGRDQAGDC